MRLDVVLIGSALIAATVAAPALAGDKPETAANDSNKKICEKESVVGSRVSTRRVCHTAQEWAEIHKRDREVYDNRQRDACIGGASSGGGMDSIKC